LVLNDHEHSACEVCRTVVNNVKEPWVDGCGSLVSQPEDNDARGLAAGDCQDISEIEIEREDDAAFHQSLRDDVRIGKAS
jgi:hypothetical protein